MTITTLRDLADGFAAALNDHDIDALRKLLHPDYVNHNPYVAAVPGPDSAVSFFSDWLAAFPDAEVICEDALDVGTLSTGTVVGRYTYLGTFTNAIFRIPPTGKQTAMRSIDIWRVRDGRLAEHWDELNTADWFAQLQGAEPQPRTGATQARTTAADSARPTHLVTARGQGHTMSVLSAVVAITGILAAGIIYGTDAFCALVQRPALTTLDDATLTAVMGRIHQYGDRRLPAPGMIGILAAAFTTTLEAIDGSLPGAIAAGVALVSMLAWLSLYRRVAAPINHTLTTAAMAHQTPDNARGLQTRWDSIITARAVLMGVAVAGLAVSAAAR